MKYRRFGKTELQVPVFSCGGMRYQHKWNDIDPSEVPADAKGGRLLDSVCKLASAAGGQWGVQGPVFVAEVPRCDPPETP